MQCSILKNIQIWQFKQKEAQAYIFTGFNPYGLVQASQLFVCIAAAGFIILITASVQSQPYLFLLNNC